MYAVLMAGGKGTRFWPKSRAARPKQLLNIIGEATMLQATVNRIRPLIPLENIYVVVGRDIEHEVRQQLPEIPEGNILVEPSAKNTAPCIGLAAVTIQKRDPQGVLAVLPADHVIGDEKLFLEALHVAEGIAEEGSHLVTLGIVPTRPETGYGHIRKGKRLKDIDGYSLYQVERFVEKPDLERAKAYTDSGQYLWNSGMFVWSLPVILEDLRLHVPDLYDGLMVIAQSLGTREEKETLESIYGSVQSISIDYGVMEKAQDVVVIPGSFGWSDVGSWASLGEIHQPDEHGNVVLCPFVGIETVHSIVVAHKKLVAAIGLQNMVIVDTPDALLICPRERVQDVKKIVEHLQAEGLDEYI
jgi:mannose-1-phosphate guanylyltransferase